MSQKIGTIEFQYCPSCLKPLDKFDGKHCIVCSAEIDEDDIRSKYFEIKIDNELQLRESRQLLRAKRSELDNLQNELRALRRVYSASVLEFSGRYDIANSPREAFLAERNKLVGGLERDLNYLDEIRATIEKIDQLSTERSKLDNEIEITKARMKKNESSATARLWKAMNSVGIIGRRILMKDLPREDTFESPERLTVDFGDDAMLVDGKMNFAESSNVVLKNTSILSLFLAACYDADFWHPKFLLMDNIEDKGMEQARSHNFQRMIVEESNKAKFKHQIIFTTSMIDPVLEQSSLTIGVRYTRGNKTLK